jgi:3-hydroxyisobutyrate dehydrogenase-like beta-hydroxyacid dehydrogenase
VFVLFSLLLSETIFNCLIYKGYGNRVGGRKHYQDGDHPGFALELGLKDIDLVVDTAKRSPTSVPMPFASLLRDRLTAAKNKGRGQLDWSAIGLSISEDGGVDVSDAVNNPRPE